MYVSNQSIPVMLFRSGTTDSWETEKVFFANVSEGFKIGDDTVYEQYLCKFVGQAKDIVKNLPSKSVIRLKCFDIRNPYDKEKNCQKPYLFVSKVDI